MPRPRSARARGPVAPTEGLKGEWTTIGVTKVVKQALDEVLFEMNKRSYNAVLTELIRMFWVSEIAEGSVTLVTPPDEINEKSRPE